MRRQRRNLPKDFTANTYTNAADAMAADVTAETVADMTADADVTTMKKADAAEKVAADATRRRQTR